MSELDPKNDAKSEDFVADFMTSVNNAVDAANQSPQNVTVAATTDSTPEIPHITEPDIPIPDLEPIAARSAPQMVELSFTQTEPVIQSDATLSEASPSIAAPAIAGSYALPPEQVNIFGPSSLDLPPLEGINPGLYQTPAPQPQPAPLPPAATQPSVASYVPPDPAQYENYAPNPTFTQQSWQQSTVNDPIKPRTYPGAGLQPFATPSSQSSLQTASAAHWGALIGDILMPVIASIAVPAIIRSSNPNDPFVRQHATEALNYGITIFLGFIASALLTILVFGVAGFIAIPILTLIFRISGAMAASRGEQYRYPINIRFIK
ncbi:MAG: DUF4870 domain-containing protein [Propionibacteriaceae bacterium]|nr:DUF4870 domain-containing protein [Propionibacteriaceae bacterium]